MAFFKKNKHTFFVLLGLILSSAAFAGAATGGIGDIADKMTGTLKSIGSLMIAIAYVAGFGFLMFGILKFKQHKDNPSQVTLGTPIVMVLIGAVLVAIGAFITPLTTSVGGDVDKNTLDVPTKAGEGTG